MEATFDVAVIGGGSAGCAAAIAAARQGARTLLVERHGFLGGAGTASLVHTFCGLYQPPVSPNDPPRLANPGLPTELAETMIAAGVAGQPMRLGRVFVLPHHPVQLAGFLDRMCRAEKNLQIWLNTEVISAETGEASLKRIETLCRGTRAKVNAAAFVDASGDAVLAEYCQQPWEMAPAAELQRPAYIVGLQGVAAGVVQGDGPIQLAGLIATAVRAGSLPGECLGAHFRESGRQGELFVTIDLPGFSGTAAYDPISSASLSALEQTGRATADALVEFLRTAHEGFARAFISIIPARAGIRESRRWVGECTLTGQDILTSANFADAVAVSPWPMELRETTKGPRLLHPTEPRAADIPLRSLRAKALPNLFLAGRCISASHEAQASIRVMGVALATGQAAGIAAAVANGEPLITTPSLAAKVNDVLKSKRSSE